MRRAILCFLFSSAAFAQVRPDAFDLSLQAYWKARQEGRFDEAASKREEVRALLDRLPAEDPQFGFRAQSVMQLYQQAGLTMKARAIAEASLARASRLGDGHPARAILLSTLADSWQQDGNLLKAAGYMEQAAAAAEAAPPAPPAVPPPAGTAPVAIMGRISAVPMMRPMAAYAGNRWFRGGGGFFMGPSEPAHLYQRLADLYQQLGRVEAAAGVRAKIRTLLKDNDMAMASFYERQGQPEQAAALYEKHAAQTAVPQERAAALQSLANSYMAQGRHGEATAALQQAVAALEATGKPEIQAQANWARLNLANSLQRAGQGEKADQVFRQALAESDKTQGQDLPILMNYANHLASTKRGTEAETLLKDYLANHASLEPQQQAQLLHGLSSAAGISGDRKRAEEYQRAAQEKQPASAGPGGQMLIGRFVERAQSAANQGNLDEAFSLTLQAIDAAPGAGDREQIAWALPSVAEMIAGRNEPAKADQLFQRLFGVVESWSAEGPQTLLNLWQRYVHYLISQRPKQREAVGAIERYRTALIAAHGPDTGRLAEVFQSTIMLESRQNSNDKAILAGQDLLALQKSLSGTTSEPYFNAVEMLAGLYAAGGDSSRALAMRLQAVAIADLVFRANDPRPATTRREAAMALAAQERFDEAERMASEAVRLGESLRPRQSDFYGNTLDQIREMRKRRN